MAFDVSTFEIWGALLSGAKLSFMPTQPADLSRLKQVLAEEQVSVLVLAAGIFHRVVDDDLQTLAAVTKLMTGGDALSPAHARRVLAELPHSG